MASVAVETWADDCATVDEIEAALVGLRDRVGHLRTSVLTHIAWVPDEWRDAAARTLRGLGERHPSRTLLVFPSPDDEDRLAARVYLECHQLEGDRRLCNEIVELDLHGRRAEAATSIVTPLLLPDLPVFLRWRGRPPFRTRHFRDFVGLVDRLVVDSAEWPDLPGAYAELDDVFELTAVSDIAWRRTLPWREELARAWPSLPDRIAGPPAEAALVAGWLDSRADYVVAVDRADKLPVAPDADPSDLLSDELDVFGRDAVYEAAAMTAGLR